MPNVTTYLAHCRRHARRYQHHLLRLGQRLVADKTGATAIEYGLILAGVATFILIAVFAVGDELQGMFHAFQTKLANAYS